jgi:2',3'-cyclic-nucleotide 2'-phosphodiesterase (5'-nucleotidase family)
VGVSLRIVSINDVYSLENLPRLRTLVASEARGAGGAAFMCVLAGDFVGPSILSSLDAGRAMVACMNDVGVTHAVLGNHEDDIPTSELRERIHELRAKVIATNVPGFEPHLPRCDVIAVGAKKVGVVGVVMEDPGVYRRPPFGGAAVLPANDAAIAEARRLRAEEGCEAVIAITHQTIDDDRALAIAAGPAIDLVIGGHEHEVFLEQAAGTWIVKAGSDAAHAAVIDVELASDGARPRVDERAGGERGVLVDVRLEDTSRYPEDAALRARVDAAMDRVRALETATLVSLPEGKSLSSVGTRSRQTSLGTLIATRARDVLGAEVCLFNGGSIRASREYTKRFTYRDLKAEVPFDNEMVVVPIPGSVIDAAVHASRSHGAPFGGFLQVDDGVVVDARGHVTAIGGRPLDPAREYHVAIVRNLLEGMDHIEPLARFARENPARIPPATSGRDVKIVVVNAFAVALWAELGGFDRVDANRDGVVSEGEIGSAIAAVTGEPASPVAAQLVLDALDTNHDRVIERDEAERVR